VHRWRRGVDQDRFLDLPAAWQERAEPDDGQRDGEERTENDLRDPPEMSGAGAAAA
jgi:hypothetical protein